MTATSDTAVRERPILFSGDMVRAILDGRKTQTRRVVKFADHLPVNGIRYKAIRPNDNPDYRVYPKRWSLGCNVGAGWCETEIGSCPYGAPSDRLWVREQHSIIDARTGVLDVERAPRPTAPCPTFVTYAVDQEVREAICPPDEWRESFDSDHVVNRPSIHMPRWASRLTLAITDVRVQRLTEISEADARAEGAVAGESSLTQDMSGTARGDFARIWDSLNAKRGHGWDANPWVWALTFKLLQQESGQ